MNISRKLFFLAVLITLSAVGFGQSLPAKYGKLDEKEIKLTNYQGANAVILVDYGEYKFDGQLGQVYFMFKRFLRIKILTEEGLKYATQTIPFYDLHKATYFPYNKSYMLKAQTLNIDKNGKIVKSKVKIKNTSETPADDEFNASLTLNFPNVKVGSVIEYEITIPTIETVNPSPWYIQYEIPTVWNELRIIAPLDFNYAVKSYNTDYFNVSEVKDITTSISYPGRLLNYNGYLYQFVRQNVPALAYGGNPLDYNNSRMFIKFMLDYASKTYLFPRMDEIFKATDPEFKYLDKSEKQTQLTDVGFLMYKKPTMEKMAKEFNRSDRFGIPMILNMGYKDTIRTLTKDSQTMEDKVNAIYNFVLNSVEWNNKYRIFVNSGIPMFMVKLVDKFSSEPTRMNVSLQKVMNKHKGSNSEINAILINLLRANRINAYPVLVSTLNNCYLDTSFFNIHQFNHVIAAVEINGEIKYLDAAAKDGKSIMTREPINEFGLLIDPKKARWVKVAEPYPVLPANEMNRKTNILPEDKEEVEILKEQ